MYDKTDAPAVSPSLTELEIDPGPRPKPRFQPDRDEFAPRAASLLFDAQYADGRVVVKLILQSLLHNPTSKGRNSDIARLKAIMALIFDEPKAPGRPKREKGDILRIISEQVLKMESPHQQKKTLMEIASDAVEEVIGSADESLAKSSADEFSANRKRILADYIESRYPHRERRIARFVVDLLAACGLDADPLPTAAIRTNWYLGRQMTAEDLEDDYEEGMESMARRD